MLLAIDQGNTNTVFAVFEGQALRGRWRAATVAERTAEEHAVWLAEVMRLDGLGLSDIDAAVIASVVPQGLSALKELARRYFGHAPLVVGEGPALGVRVLVDHPDEVGADRLVNALAAHESYSGALIVLDFGTATTFDVVDAEGSYLGGVIAPGINLSLRALHEAAARLPRIDVERPPRVIGRGTVAAMQSGVFWGYVGLIEGIVARIKDEFGRPMTTVATGGLAPLFAEATQVIDRVDPDLTIRGLLCVHRRRREET